MVALALAACANPEALKDDKPVEQFAGPAKPTAVAECLTLEMQTIDPGNTIKKLRSGSGFRIVGNASTVPIYDIDVQPTAEGSRVVLRAYRNVWGGHIQPNATSDVIRKCVGA